ncbi:MAG: glycosyltransferase family 2 protein [Thermoguttaceae bacterium]
MQGVSVIIPVWNREVFLKDAIESALSQEYDGPIEIIVADDGSTDRSIEVAESFGPPVKVIRKPADCNVNGVGTTRNRGIAESTMPYIAFLDSDDMFLPGHIQRLADTLDNEPDVMLVMDICVYKYANGATWKMRFMPDEGMKFHEALFFNKHCLPSTVMIRKTVFQYVDGVFDESLIAEDKDLFLRIMEKFPARSLDGDGTIVREHDGRSVRNLRRACKMEDACINKAIKRFPYPKSLIRKQKSSRYYYRARRDYAEHAYLRCFYNTLVAICLDPYRVITKIKQKILTFGNSFLKK